MKWRVVNYYFICSGCFLLAMLCFSCLISGPLSHLTGPIIRLITPVSVILSSSLDPSSVQKVQRPCQHPWMLVSIWEIQHSYKRILWMWVWLPEFLCTHFTIIMEISCEDLFCWIIFQKCTSLRITFLNRYVLTGDLFDLVDWNGENIYICSFFCY